MTKKDLGPPKNLPHIGAFVLETLTLGMYGEPRHTLREYVQNAFDSIKMAQKQHTLNGVGRVKIVLEKDAIRIHDNGMGISEKAAWSTLTSIGASKKDRQKDAGFRGIGRLAGMAYCDELCFRTSFKGEKSVSAVRFDCRRLLDAMKPDSGGSEELSSLLDDAISMDISTDDSVKDQQFFEVILSGLSNTPKSLRTKKDVVQYLSETVPVSFKSDWGRATEINQRYQKFFGTDIEVIDVFVIEKGDEQQIFKSYDDACQVRGGSAKLDDIKCYEDVEAGWWAWIGILDTPAAVTDNAVRGIRLRLRNIQIGGANKLERYFTEVKPSYGRFYSYYVGEIHIDPGKLIPNARRDGFEETEAYEAFRYSIVSDLCDVLASDAYRRSREKQIDADKVIDDIQKLVVSSSRLIKSSNATYDRAVDLLTKAKRIRLRAMSALKDADDVDETASESDIPDKVKKQNDRLKPQPKAELLKTALGDVRTIESGAQNLLARSLKGDVEATALRKRLREEFLIDVLGVLESYLDTETFQSVKQKLKGTL